MPRQARKPTAAERNRRTQERIRKQEVQAPPASGGGGGLTPSWAAVVFDSGTGTDAVQDTTVASDRWMPVKFASSDAGDSGDGWTVVPWRNPANTALIPPGPGAYICGARGTFHPVIPGDAGPYDFTIYAGIAVLYSSGGTLGLETASAATYRLSAINTGSFGNVGNLTEFATSIMAPVVVSGDGDEVGFAAWFSIASTTYAGSLTDIEINLAGGSGPGSWGGMNLWAAKVG